MPYADREQYLAYQRAYARRHREKNIARAVEWNRSNPERRKTITARRRARKRAAAVVAFSPEQLRQRLEVSGGRCQHCGSTENLQVDHKKPLAVGGPHCLSNLQHLCATCNCRKGARFSG